MKESMFLLKENLKTFTENVKIDIPSLGEEFII